MFQGIISYVRRRPLGLEHAVKAAIGSRGITASSPICAKKMPDRPPLVDESEFTEAFLKGSGPGGQKIVCYSSRKSPLPSTCR
jgi:hypothetical protein